MTPTGAPVDQFLAAVPEEQRRADARQLCVLLQEVTHEPPAMWGAGVVGFGSYHYRYASGREGDTSIVSLSSRKQYISLYVQCTVRDEYVAERYKDRLPKADIGKSCIRFKRADDIDFGVLRELLVEAGENSPADAAGS